MNLHSSLPDPHAETAALARGGRTSFFGFLLRLMARLPFLFIAGQLYGAAALGRFAYATLIVELMALLATLGLKRGLASALARTDQPHAQVIGDALVLAWGLAALGAGFLALFPQIVFPNTWVSGFDQAFPLVALAIVGSDVALSALAFKHRIGAQVTARSIVEPWVLTLVAAGLAFTHFKRDGLIIAYVLSLIAALGASLWPCLKTFGWPHGWRPHPERLFRLARENIPLAGADAIEWGSRRLDVLILGLFAGADTVGVYYVAQQVASLPQKLKTSFDPVLGPVLSKNLVSGNHMAVAAHIRQVSFWIIAAQLGVALALGVPGEAVLGLVGHDFLGGETILGFLLIAEVLAATGAVAEAALIYASPHRNLMLSLVGIGSQAAATLVLVPLLDGAGAAAGLAFALLLGSVLKARLLSRLLAAPIIGWRWALLPAAAVAIGAGLVCRQFPAYWQLVGGIPLILGVYGAILWSKGFRASDRLLFARRRRMA